MRKSLIALAVLGLFTHGALAQDIIIDQGDVYGSNIEIGPEDKLENAGNINNDRIIINGASFINTGSLTTDRLEFNQLKFDEKNDSPTLAGEINAKTILYTVDGYDDTPCWEAKTQTDELKIVGGTKPTGLTIENPELLNGIGSIYIESTGTKTGLRIGLQKSGRTGQNFEISGPLTLVDRAGNQQARVEIFNGNHVHFASVTAIGDKGLIQTNNTSSATIDLINVDKDSILNFQTLVDSVAQDYDANKTNASDYQASVTSREVNLSEGAQLRAGIYADLKKTDLIPYDTQTTPSLVIAGNQVTMNLAAGAGVDFGGWKDEVNSDWRPEDIYVRIQSLTINVEDSSSGNYVYLTGVDGHLQTQPGNIRVVGAASNNTGNPEEDLTKLANVVKTNVKVVEDGQRQNDLNCLPGVIVEQEPTDILDGAIGEVADGCPNCTIGNVRLTANPNIHGIAEMAALGLHVWRNEIDDMHRRVGELRDNAAQSNGLWTRVYHGKAEYGAQDVTNRYTAFQFGYDRQVGDGFWLGAAFSYTDGNNDFNYGDGDSNLYAFSGYGSWLWDNGLYLDVVGKVGRMKNSFDINFNGYDSTGSYHTNAASLSAEAGWRYYATEQIYIEPQVQMWYGHVMDADYRTSTGINVENDSVDSLVGRAGIKMGFKDSEGRGGVFLKASVLHDWKGDADFRFGNAEGVTRQLTESLGGTWYEYGLGADFNATQQVRIYADIEAANGGEVDTDYRFNLGVRYAW